LKDKDIEYFQRLIKCQKKTARKFTKAVKVSERALEASFLVANMIAKEMKPHNIGETLVKPACREIVKLMLGEDASAEIDNVSLSNDTVARRIRDMSNDISVSTATKMKISLFSLQVDEFTDCAGKSSLIGFTRFVDGQNIVNQFLFLLELKTTTTGEDIFEAVNGFFMSNEIPWSDCVSICTDGAPSMRGKYVGFVTRAKKVNPSISTIHCFLHREALMKKTLRPDFQTVLNDAVKMVNKIKGQALNSRLFAQI